MIYNEKGILFSLLRAANIDYSAKNRYIANQARAMYCIKEFSEYENITEEEYFSGDKTLTNLFKTEERFKKYKEKNYFEILCSYNTIEQL